MLGAGVSQESMGLGIVQVSQGPVCTQSMFDPVSGHRVKNKLCFILCQDKAFEDKMNCQFQRVS
jgi:hypothetical protein